MRLAGVECFEGLDMTGDDDADRTKVDRWIHAVHTVARQCDAEKLYGTSEVTLTAGGSAVFDLVARALPMSLSRPVRAILRSGCYLTHDSGMYTRFARTMRSRNDATWREGDGLKPALEIWTHVQSRPEPGLAILAFGKRDARSTSIFPCLWRASATASRAFRSVRHSASPAQRPARVHGSAGGRRRARG
jgi:D-serine dehydratase